MKIDIFHNGELIDSREFGEGSWKVGRAPECDIQLKSPQISKQHALLVIKGNRAAIVDVGSSNGVFVNGILVKKQRIEMDDEVTIVDFQLRLARPGRPKSPRPAGAEVSGGFEGNLATNMAYDQSAEEAAPALTPQEKFLQLMDQRILVPFYGLMRTYDWRWILSCILLIALVSSVLLSVIPIVRWGKNITNKESLARAHTVITQTVRENARLLSKTNDFTRLTVEAAENEPGILNVFIIDPKTTSILAPAKLFNKQVNNNDFHTLLVIKRIMAKEEQVSVQKDDNIHIIAQPITIFSQETNQPEIAAIVIANFEVKTEITSTFEPMVEAALFAVILSLAAYFMIFKMFTHPIIQMQNQLDAALKGENVSVVCESKFPELENLATVINFSLSRLRQGGGAGMAQPSGGNDDDAEIATYIRCIEEIDLGTSDAILLLDKEKKVRFVGKVLEDLIGLRNNYAQGQNISDACRDASFAGTAIDMAEQVVSSLGEVQYAQLDINGVTRNIVGIGHRNSAGEIGFVLITVKMST